MRGGCPQRVRFTVDSQYTGERASKRQRENAQQRRSDDGEEEVEPSAGQIVSGASRVRDSTQK